jgi:hypothetical protein
MDFLSQSYKEAYYNHSPSFSIPSPSTIQISTNSSKANISNLLALEKQLSDDIATLETIVTPQTSPREKRSNRYSMPPTPRITPSPTDKKTNGFNLQFTRSMSRLSRSSSESPRSMRSEHCKNFKSMKLI